MSICLAKGLCCPSGSIVLGGKDDIVKIKQIRKSIGGGMRQIGILAAAALYSVEHIVPQLC